MKRYTLLLLLLPALLAACGGYSKSTTKGSPSTVPPTSTAAAPSKMNDHGAKNVSALSSVNVKMADYFFSPTTLEGKPGQKLTLNLSNQGSTTHNVTITHEQISQNVAPGKTAIVHVTFPKSGRVEFLCKFHAHFGMVGELQVGTKMGPNPTSTGSTTTTSNYGSGGY